MINIEIEARLPNLENLNFTSTFEKIARHMELSIKRNFAEGGRPETWTPLKKNGQPSHLYKTGKLFGTMGSNFGETFAEAGAMTLLPYSWVHQRGGGNNIPARPYVLFQQEDIDFIMQEFSNDIVKFWDTSGEVIA